MSTRIDIDTERPWLAQRAARDPEAVALRLGDRTISWAALAAEARGLAAALAGRGIGRGDLVAVRMAPHPRMIALLHALQELGAAMLPLNRRLVPAERRRILAHARPRLIVDGEGDRRGLPGDEGDGGVHPFDDLQVGDVATASLATEALEAGRALAVVYTSGTTGDPKGVVLTNANFAAAARVSQRRLGHGAGDVWLATLPLFHVGGLAILVRSVLEGSAVLLEDGFDEARVASVLERGEATMVSLVPTMLVRVLDRLRAPVSPRVRCVLVGGASLAPELGRRALEAGLPVSATYGMTEACSQIASSEPGSEDAACGLVGRPLDDVSVEIRDADEQGWGEIVVRGPNVTAGYLHEDQDDRGSRGDGWLPTGDFGRLHEDGRLEVSGRRSDLIVTGGENVSPTEVEGVLDGHADVAESLVVGVDDDQWGQALLALVVAAEGRRPEPEDLRLWCRQRLAAYKTPREIRLVEALPRTPTGKLLRRRDPGGTGWPSVREGVGVDDAGQPAPVARTRTQ